MTDPGTPMRNWDDMRVRSERLLITRTGVDLAEWNRRVRETGIGTEPELRAWLAEQGVTGYGQMLVVYENLGYPDFLTASADELIDGQYADRPALRPVFDQLIQAAVGIGEVDIQARKTYVALYTARRKFAVLKPTTKTRIDVGLRLPDAAVGGRFENPKILADPVLTVRIVLTAPEQVDDELVEILARARDANK